jgi:hypothetical protein
LKFFWGCKKLQCFLKNFLVLYLCARRRITHSSTVLFIITLTWWRLKKKGKLLFSPVFPNFWNSIPFWKATRLFLLIRATFSWIWAWRTGEMMIGENQTTQRKTYPSASLPATNLTWTGLNWTYPSAVISWLLTRTYIIYND